MAEKRRLDTASASDGARSRTKHCSHRNYCGIRLDKRLLNSQYKSIILITKAIKGRRTTACHYLLQCMEKYHAGHHKAKPKLPKSELG